MTNRQAPRGRGGILHWLGGFPLLHRTVDRLQLYRAGNALLRRIPARRRVAGGRIAIRIRSLAGFLLAEEIFQRECYRVPLEGIGVRTFADLGCNVGWFACYLASVTARDVRGLLVDGDPAMIEEACWHLSVNQLPDCHAVLGAVGCGNQSEVTFFINPANTQSASHDFSAGHPYPVKGQVRRVTVPAVRLETLWRERFGEEALDVLKVDIEGSELDFLRQELEFIEANVRRVICEWHEWRVKFDELDALATGAGFRRVAITEQDRMGGVVVYDNPNLTPR